LYCLAGPARVRWALKTLLIIIIVGWFNNNDALTLDMESRLAMTLRMLVSSTSVKSVSLGGATARITGGGGTAGVGVGGLAGDSLGGSSTVSVTA